MTLIFSNLLLYLALGAYFRFTDAQSSTERYTMLTSLNINTVGSNRLRSENTIAGTVNAVTELQTKPDMDHLETTPDYRMSTMLKDLPAVNTVPLSIKTDQTTAEIHPETTTPAEREQTTMFSTYVPANVERAVTEQITSDAPSTLQYETTVAVSSSELTSPTEVEKTEEITTAAVAITIDFTVLNPASITPQPPADWTVPLSDLVETSTITSTAALTSSSERSLIIPGVHSDLTFDDESVSTQLTSVTAGENVKESIGPSETNWLLIIILCVIIIFVLCVGMILFTQRRKKKASQTFDPMHVNGQSKRSKKKKGAGDDAWAGPVNMEAGLECDAEVQDGLLPVDGKQDGDDMVLSTFAALDESGMSNGGVGGEGTKEAKKWEEQEHLLYIDEDVDENKAGKTLAEDKTQKADEKSEEKELNGGETFCLTTAV